MAKKKRVYLLPHNETYEIVSSFHTGGIEGEGFLPCDNCGALLSKIVVVKDSNNKKSYIGADCAKTLTSIKEEDLESTMKLFKYGESIRKSILNKLKVSTISIISVENLELENNYKIQLISNNNGRNGYCTYIKDNNLADTHILPQLKDLIGTYIRSIKITNAELESLKNMLKEGMVFNPNSYCQSIKSIDFKNNEVICNNDYMKSTYERNGNGDEEVSTSKRTILSVLGDCLYTEPTIKARQEFLTKNTKKENGKDV